MQNQKTILVAPLNWGLGHATRCIPVIRALTRDGFKVIVASDGQALELLKLEFPHLQMVRLPSYNVEYARDAKFFKLKMLLHSPKIANAIAREHAALEILVAEYKLDGVISDNRLGLYHGKIPTVFITHQLQVLSGKTTSITTALHQRYIKKFTECWVPDYPGENNLSGKLGHPKSLDFPVHYIGPLSRFEKEELPMEYDVTAVLSGPEPQRSQLEEILRHELKHYRGDTLLVRGVVKGERKTERDGSLTIENYLTGHDLQDVLNSSKTILSRSGYTTIMDLAALGKKAFFIPTPGQSEQEYLAKRLKKHRTVPFVEQDVFKIKDLSKVSVYDGFSSRDSGKVVKLQELFGLFKGERKFGTDSRIAFNINLLIMRLNDVLDNGKA